MNEARVTKVVLGLALFMILIQILQPKRTNPRTVASRTLGAHVPIPPAVQMSFRRACGDCHSNQTAWPWYSRIAPLSWVVIDDVNQGRRHMNFDDWDAQADSKQANDRLIDICQEIRKKGMPPFSYRLLRKDLELKSEEIAALCAWSESFRSNPMQLERPH